jgi:hypothetical protein
VIKSELQYIKKYRIGGVEYQIGIGYRTAPHRIAKPAKIPVGIPIGAEAYCGTPGGGWCAGRRARTKRDVPRRS